ncbi:hypothetical protein N7468_008858 [Penicillium chermesinum]|uniref:C2H2-type domain-containing protein n=1 Tax=Penicillium chermesinum TaxID=63820 RepID=A0A9W9NJA4_9EURO|nr:uncharacterized protein N7468_008858 [Penicillium chermesinum]KAJ5219654.1 hypothetical protein N7468_008858 [Penicillium chermesinum]KAJ6153658.1 hypothetical protein N7470_006617 [Penicillium chermesinum]
MDNLDHCDDQWSTILERYPYISTPQATPRTFPGHSEGVHVPGAYVPATPSMSMSAPFTPATGSSGNTPYILYTPLSISSSTPAYYTPQPTYPVPPHMVPAFAQPQPYSPVSHARTTSFQGESPPGTCAEDADKEPPSPSPSAAGPSCNFGGLSHAGRFKCEWKGCRYNGAFGRWAELKRHIETKHVYPNHFQCYRCKKQYNRKDNLEEHCKKAHPHDP